MNAYQKHNPSFSAYLIGIIAVFLLLCQPVDTCAQPLRDNPPWDYHLQGWRFYGKMGLGITFGNHNKRVSLIAALNLDYTRVGKQKGFSGDPHNLPIYDNKVGWRGGLHYDFSVTRNFKLYNKRMKVVETEDQSEVRIQDKNAPSWTFANELGFTVGMACHSPEFRKGLKHISDKTFPDTRVELKYSIRSLYHTSHFRKLSNVIGEVRLNYGKANDRWNGTLSWGNDMFLFGLFGPLRRDHGVSNRLTIGGSYRRPDDSKELIGKYSLEYENIIFTGRRSGMKMHDPRSKMGMYQVLELDKDFHNYHRFNIGLSGDYFNLMLTPGLDDLLAGRNTQRFAHQGFSHLPYKKRKKKLLNRFGGTDSPLYPWEEDPDFHQKPKLLLEVMLEGFIPVNTDPF